MRTRALVKDDFRVLRFHVHGHAIHGTRIIHTNRRTFSCICTHDAGRKPTAPLAARASSTSLHRAVARARDRTARARDSFSVCYSMKSHENLHAITSRSNRSICCKNKKNCYI